MSDHTPEPWESVETRVYLGAAGGFDLRGAPSAEANARRIVACVNACAGTTTSDLEQIAAHGGWNHISADWKLEQEGVEQERDRLAALNAELLAALEMILETNASLRGLDNPTEFAISQARGMCLSEIKTIAKSAITKHRGQQL